MANQPKSYRKFLAGSVTAAIVASAVAPAFAAEVGSNFSDVPASNSHSEDIAKAVSYELMKGYPNNTFQPGKALTRSDVVKTIARYLEKANGEVDTTNVTPFADVTADYTDGELYKASLVVKKYNVFAGDTKGNLNPADKISRQAMAKVLVNAFGLDKLDADASKVKDNDLADEWARTYINTLSGLGITTETMYRPTETTDRGQFASFLVRSYEKVMDVTAEVTGASAINSQGMAVDLTAVPVTGAIQVKFSEKVDAESINVNNLRVYKMDGNVPVSIAASNFSLSQDGLTATVDIDGAGLDKNTAYKLEVKNVKSSEGAVVADKTVNFTTSTTAVVTNAYFAGVASDNDNNAPTGVAQLDVAYDVKLSPSTVTTSNVTLVDLATGNKVPLNLSTANNTINITTDAALPDGKQYKLSVSGVKTATGEDAEAYTKTFAVNAATPLTAPATVTTLDGRNALITDVWPKLSSGIKEAGNTYYAGLQLNVGIAEKLDASTIQQNVQLVEKDSKEVVSATFSYNSDAKILTVVPTSDLKESTDYEIQFKGGLKSAEGIYLDGAHKGEVVTSESLGFTTLDVTAPTVTSVTSKNGLSGLKLNETQEFTVKLSEPLALSNSNVVLAETGVDFTNQTSITNGRIPANKLQVTAVPGQEATYSVKVAANSLTQNKAYKLVVVGKDLSQSTLVTGLNSVTVATDGAGNTLKNSFSTAFTTEGADVTAPKLAKVYKGTTLTAANEVTKPTNVVSTNSFTFAFDETIGTGATNIDSSKFKLQKFNGSTWVDESGASASTTAIQNTAGQNVGVNVTLSGVAMDDAQYRIVVEAGAVKDLATNLSSQQSVFEFTGTEGDDTAAKVEVATGSVSGGAFTQSNDGDQNIYVTFDEDEIFEVATDSVKVTDASGKQVTGTLKEIDQPTALTSLTGANKVYEFVPAEELNAGAVYTVTVEGVKDIAGNTIAKKVVQFTTSAASLDFASATVTNGAQAVDRQKTISVDLNKKVNGETVNVVLTNEDTTTVVATNTITAGYSSTDFMFDDVNNLLSNTNYSIKVVIDGTTVKTINFTTGVVATDDVAPWLDMVEGQAYVNSNTLIPNVDITTGSNTTLDFDFSEAIAAGVTASIVNLSDADAPTSVVTTSRASDILSLTLSNSLVSSNIYQVTLTGVKDADGNAADPIVVKFTAQ
ncbi:Ig-like domain-containing protein [Falsibacillus pallidus]|uniref:Ig-like domain-containing protein n=1 Tax=Falsibacillus pallidus TaxID=493781 RepID=UPI003D98CEDA